MTSKRLVDRHQSASDAKNRKFETAVNCLTVKIQIERIYVEWLNYNINYENVASH